MFDGKLQKLIVSTHFQFDTNIASMVLNGSVTFLNNFVNVNFLLSGKFSIQLNNLCLYFQA